MNIIRTLVQIGIATIIMLIVAWVSIYIYNKDVLRAMRYANKSQKVVHIFEGVGTNASVIEFNTKDRTKTNYKELYSSVNQPGGIEVSYQWWFSVNTRVHGNPQGTDVAADIPNWGEDSNETLILLKGDKNKYKYNTVCAGSEQKLNPDFLTKDDYLIKCPLIKLEYNDEVPWLTVEFNTLNSADSIQNNVQPRCGVRDTWANVNRHKLSTRIDDSLLTTSPENVASDKEVKWFLVTVVLSDMDFHDFGITRNKVNVKVFFNDTEVLNKYTTNIEASFKDEVDEFTTLKENHGNLYVNIEPEKFKIGYLKFYNYALTFEDIVLHYTLTKSNTRFDRPMSEGKNTEAPIVTNTPISSEIKATTL